MDQVQIFGMIVAVLIDALNHAAVTIDGDFKGDISCIRFNMEGTVIGLRLLVGGVDMFVQVSHTPEGLMDQLRNQVQSG